MEGKRLSLPGQRHYEQAYELAYKLAREQLAGISDTRERCLSAGASYEVMESREVALIEYLNRRHQIAFPDGNVSLAGSQEEVPLKDKVLILHYFLLAKGTPLANKMVTYKELPDGLVYFPTFYQRTIKPLLKHLGSEPERLLDIAAGLGGRKADYGDAAVTINALPRVPVTLVMWRGDEEFGPEGSILFDATISGRLPTEDITILCETITWRLIKGRG